MEETRRKRVIQKQKVRDLARMGLVSLGLIPCLTVTEDTLLICLFGISIAVVVAVII